MAKGQVRGNKEPKKPKGGHDHPKKGSASAYQQSKGQTGAENPFSRKT